MNVLLKQSMETFPKILMILGSGELGKEIAIAGQRLGCKVIACDRYEGAPAMQVADIGIVINMSDTKTLQSTIRKHKPDVVIPEIEALSVEALKEIEAEGINVIPTARATAITMNRDKIRSLASEKLGIKTAKYAYSSSKEQLKKIAEEIKYPLIIKPVMSSSGKGQSLVKESKDINKAWDYAIKEARGNSTKVIIEEYIDFQLEITLLTIREKNGSTKYCSPIGHEQINGDYQSSWQPQVLRNDQLQEMHKIAKKVTDELGGTGLFGVEFFIRNEEVIFSELSPRPHDTGLVTLISQNLSEFDLHLRAILGIPIPEIKCFSASASRVILSKDNLTNVSYIGIEEALKEKDTELLIFGKPNAHKGRRMGVVLAKGDTINQARIKAEASSKCIKVI